MKRPEETFMTVPALSPILAVAKEILTAANGPIHLNDIASKVACANRNSRLVSMAQARRWVATSLLLLSGSVSTLAIAQAVVYRCTDPDTGSVTFSQIPCKVGQESSSKIVRPNSIDASGSREFVMRHEMRRIEAEAQAQQERLQQLQSAESNLYQQKAPHSEREMEQLKVACEYAKDELDRAIRMGRAEIAVSMAYRNKGEACKRYRDAQRRNGELVTPHTDTVQRTHEQDVPQPSIPVPTGPKIITNCDAAGCWGTDGTRYKHVGPGNFVSQDGKFCNQQDVFLHCN